MAERGTGPRMSPWGSAVQTLPEQVANDLGASIAWGAIHGGERLLEQDISERYGVSRGTVREALLILQVRGLASLYPRRGAFAVDFNLDRLVDLFNMRASISALATRYFAALASDRVLEEMDRAITALQDIGAAPETDAPHFTRATARVGALIILYCGSESLTRILKHEDQYSAWGMLWQKGGLDFMTHARRLSSASDYSRMNAALQKRDGETAEQVMRHMVLTSRENAVEALAKARGETYDTRRLLGA